MSEALCDLLEPIGTKEWTSATKPILGHTGSVRAGFAKAVQAAGLPGKVTPKTLRHTWATWAAQRGVSVWLIAGMLGDSVETVERNYMHHSPDHLRGALRGA